MVGTQCDVRGASINTHIMQTLIWLLGVGRKTLAGFLATYITPSDIWIIRDTVFLNFLLPGELLSHARIVDSNHTVSNWPLVFCVLSYAYGLQGGGGGTGGGGGGGGTATDTNVVNRINVVEGRRLTADG